jgi:hypothetical protein
MSAFDPKQTSCLAREAQLLLDVGHHRVAAIAGFVFLPARSLPKNAANAFCFFANVRSGTFLSLPDLFFYPRKSTGWRGAFI